MDGLSLRPVDADGLGVGVHRDDRGRRLRVVEDVGSRGEGGPRRRH